jgi:peptidoglycan/xylan/chitin deacetylase (PgdA/CDA1 family)
MKRGVALVVSLAYASVATAGRCLAKLFGWNPGSSVVVLTYHTVAPTDLDRFESQMRLLRAHATPVFVDDTQTPNGRPFVAITFDDAFQSVFDRALPILAKYDIPATIFVPTAYLGGQPGWTVTPGTANPPSGTIARATTLASVDRRLVKLGSHTVTHPRLAALATRQVENELMGSRQALEELTGDPVRLLALPYGSFSDEVLVSASRAGYHQVFANVPVTGHRPGARLVGRINVSPADSLLEFRLKAAGAYDWLAAAIPVKRAITRGLGRLRA